MKFIKIIILTLSLFIASNSTLCYGAIYDKDEYNEICKVLQENNIVDEIKPRNTYINNMIKVNFVCHGNICRSPMAEFILKKMAKDRGIDISVSSSATSYEEIGNDIHPGTKRVLTAHSIPFSKRGATHFEKEDYKNNDYILCMDSYNIKNLKRIIGSDPENKVHLLLEYDKSTRDISDPWYTGNFDLTYDDIVEGCEGFLDYLAKNNLI